MRNIFDKSYPQAEMYTLELRGAHPGASWCTPWSFVVHTLELRGAKSFITHSTIKA